MEIQLKIEDFINNKLVVPFGENKSATFTIVDEMFPGMDVKYNVITCFTEYKDNTGVVTDSFLSVLVVGLGDNVVGSFSSNASLRGLNMRKETMSECTVVLYE